MAAIFTILDNSDKDRRYTQQKEQIQKKNNYVKKKLHLRMKKKNYLILRFARVFGEWCMQHWVKILRNKNWKNA